MVKRNYQAEVQGKGIARAFSANSRISLKYATEMCREIRGKRLDKAVAMLERIAEKKDFLPLKKFNRKVAHRKGQSKSGVKSGRYPVKACKAFVALLESVKANADFKGLDSENLLIAHAFSSMGVSRYGMQSKGRIGGKRRKRKSTHIEVIVREGK